MSASVVRDLDGLDALRDEWDALGSSLPSPMQEWAWTRCAAETLGRYRPNVVVVDGAIAPLGRPRGVARLESLGARELHEPVDLLWRDEHALAELAEALRALGLPLVLTRLPLDSPALAAVRRVGSVALRRRDSMPVIDLDETWRDPESQYGTDRRSDFRRARRRAESVGEVGFELATPGPDDVASLLDDALAVETRSWKAGKGSALADDALRLPFYRRYCAEAAAAGTLRILFLRIGGRRAAMQVACERGGGFWLLKIAYDSEFARASPGQLLMLEAIRHAAEQGLRTFEFIGSSAAWTRLWTKRERAIAYVHVYPRRVASVPALARDLAEDGAKTLLRRVRA